jgi:dUTP pyrophosphatase
MNIEIKRLHKNAVVPSLATEGAACSDVVATEIEYAPGDNKATVKLGIAMAIPKGYKVCIAPRSSFTKFIWVMQNSPAQIDSDYRGELMLKFTAIPAKVITTTGFGEQTLKQPKTLYTAFPYKIGDRVGQMWLEKIVDYTFKEVEELDETKRGEGGFGSTGNT